MAADGGGEGGKVHLGGKLEVLLLYFMSEDKNVRGGVLFDRFGSIAMCSLLFKDLHLHTTLQSDFSHSLRLLDVRSPVWKSACLSRSSLRVDDTSHVQQRRCL